MQMVNYQVLYSLYWWQLLAVIIHLYGSSKNVDIINNYLTTEYIKKKNNKSVPQTVANILKNHSIEGRSGNKNEPRVFFKENGLWCLTDGGKHYVEQNIKKGLFISK